MITRTLASATCPRCDFSVTDLPTERTVAQMSLHISRAHSGTAKAIRITRTEFTVPHWSEGDTLADLIGTNL